MKAESLKVFNNKKKASAVV